MSLPCASFNNSRVLGERTPRGGDGSHHPPKAERPPRRGLVGAATGLKQVAAEWIWSGEELKYPIAPNVANHEMKSLGTTQQARTKQKANYDAVMDMFDSVLKRIATPATSAADKSSDGSPRT